MLDCNCQNCVLHRELKRAERVVEHVAVRLGHSPHHSGDEIIQTFDFVMERYDQFAAEALAAHTAAAPPPRAAGEGAASEVE